MSVYEISSCQVTPEFPAILPNEHMCILSVYATFHRNRKHIIKANLETTY